MVTTLVPTRSGTLADQLAVPDAMPALPVELVHFTAATVALSLAVPLIVMLAEEVETIVDPGDLMLRDGGVVSGAVGGGGCAGGCAGGCGDGGTRGCTTGGCAGVFDLLPYRSRIPAMSSSVSPLTR